MPKESASSVHRTHLPGPVPVQRKGDSSDPSTNECASHRVGQRTLLLVLCTPCANKASHPVASSNPIIVQAGNAEGVDNRPSCQEGQVKREEGGLQDVTGWGAEKGDKIDVKKGCAQCCVNGITSALQSAHVLKGWYYATHHAVSLRASVPTSNFAAPPEHDQC